MTREPERIDLGTVMSGPIRYESLPPELLYRIGAIYGLLGRYLNTTLEQFELGFMRDMQPDDEVAIWSSIAAAWADYHHEFLDNELLPEIEEQKLIGALIGISAGVDDPANLNLPPDVGRRLLRCYENLGTSS